MIQLDNDKVFENPSLYDFAFSWDLSSEISFFKEIFSEKNLKLLIPACGTGRYALQMAQQGTKVTAFDLHPKMLGFALSYRNHPNLSYFLGDMITFAGIPDEDYDGGLLLNNSFRYLLKREEAHLHLKNVGLRLKEDGLYLMELGLNENASFEKSITKWSVQRGDATVYAQWKLKKYDPPYVLDEVHLRLESPTHEEVITENQRQLSWTFQEFIFALEGTFLKLESVYNAQREKLNNLEKISHECGKYYLLLRKKKLE